MNIHGIQSVGTLTQQAGGFATLSGSFTGSFKGDGSQLTGVTATFNSSSLLSTASFNAYTASTDTRLTNLEATTSSLNTSASLALITASFDNGTRNLTFTKGDTTQFSVNIPDASGSLPINTGSFATTGSNTFVGDQTIVKNSGGKYILTAGGVPVYYGQTATSNFEISQSGSAVMRGSDAVTQQFDVLWKPTFLAGVNTAGLPFATTGSNTFVGDQTINANLIGNGGVYVLSGNGISLQQNLQGSGSQYPNINITIDSTTWPTDIYGGLNIADSAGIPGMTYVQAAANSYTPQFPGEVVGWIGGGANNVDANNTAIIFRTGSANMYVYKPTIFGYDVYLSGSLTASLQTGYLWVGNGSGKTTTIPTSSFVVNLAPLNQATASLQQATASLQTFSASAQISINALNAQTASALTSLTAINGATASLQIFSASINQFTTSINTFTASYYIDSASAATVRNANSNSISLLSAATSSYVVKNTANSLTGSQTISGSLNVTGSAYGNVVSMSITTNTASMDLSAGNYFELTSSVTPLRIEFTNIKPGLSSTLIISASASSSIILGSGAAQPSGSAYSGSAGSIDILSLVAFNTTKINVVATKALI